MNLAQNIRKSYRDFQQGWARMADSAFGRAHPASRDDSAGGEFISPFITEHDLSFPARTRPDRTSR